jgi:hypothetical protein
MLGTNTVAENSSIQGIVQIVYKPKDEEFFITHEQLFGLSQAKRRVLTKGMTPPAHFSTYWESMIYVFMEAMSCDVDLWKEGTVRKVVFPVASAKGDMVSIQAALGRQTPTAKEKYLVLSEDHRACLQELEKGAVQWILELEKKALQEEATRPVQQNLLELLPGGKKIG